MTDLEGAGDNLIDELTTMFADGYVDKLTYRAAKEIARLEDALASITRERDAYALTMAEARAQVETVHKALIKTDRDDQDPTQVAIDRASNLLDLDEGQRLLRERDAMREAHRPYAEAFAFWNGQEGGISDENQLDDQGLLTVAHLRLSAALVNGEVGE